MKVAHYVIAAPGKEGRALDALAKAGVAAKTFPAIMAGGLSDTLAQTPLLRFGGGTIKRTPSQHGAWLSHTALVSMGRALAKEGGLEWLGVWEEDAALVEGAGALIDALLERVGPQTNPPLLKGGTFEEAHDLRTPPVSRAAGFADAPFVEGGPQIERGDFRGAGFSDGPVSQGALSNPPVPTGVVFVGGILWDAPDKYGEHLGAGLWRLNKASAISGSHAVLIHARAMNDVLRSYARCDMTEDDLLALACVEAMNARRWSTCFVQPWIAWQVDRRETWPS